MAALKPVHIAFQGDPVPRQKKLGKVLDYIPSSSVYSNPANIVVRRVLPDYHSTPLTKSCLVLPVYSSLVRTKHLHASFRLQIVLCEEFEGFLIRPADFSAGRCSGARVTEQFMFSFCGGGRVGPSVAPRLERVNYSNERYEY